MKCVMKDEKQEACRSGTALVLSALEKRLLSRNIPFNRRTSTQLCYPTKSSIEGRGIASKVDEYFRGAAILAVCRT